MSDFSTTLVPHGLTLVLGGARSGKSAYAENLIEAAGGGIYLASAEALDDEMTDRISRHRARRGGNWETIEEPLEIAAVFARLTGDKEKRPVLFDCLTLWLSNLLHRDRDIDTEMDDLAEALKAASFPIVAVSNEVGGGIVPDNRLARAFVDRAGLMNQHFAAIADRVILVTAGIPLQLK